MHPTSLPGPFGIGDLGPEALRFLDWLHAAGQAVWQVLPLGPTGYGDSPYQCFSAFAGNPLLISPEQMALDGLIDAPTLAGAPQFPAEAVDFGPVIGWKTQLFAAAAARFGAHGSPALRSEFDAWCSQHAPWLEDYALFRALKDAHGGRAWFEWPEALRRREPAALAEARTRFATSVAEHRFLQWTFFRQWGALRAGARARGIAILGDAPIFIAHDSADVWSRPELFHLHDDGRPSVVAGVPPDYFSATGQLWGNPLYRWDRLQAEGHAWWIARLRAQFEMVDRLRLDHFIGFTRYWEVPADAPDARAGRFVAGPGAALFEALEAALGALPIVAEDLGVLTAEVEALRDRFALPGMKILQFAFGGESNSAFLPHAYVPNVVAYTGTHDNDTTVGWWRSAAPHEREFLMRYLAREVHDPAWDLVRAGMASVADTFITPAQDLLALPGEARMNFPGRPSGNWSWRVAPEALDSALAGRLREMTRLYGRLPA